MHAKSLQSRPTRCNSMDCSPPSSSVYGILQERILEWVAIPFSRGPSHCAPGTLQTPAGSALLLKRRARALRAFLFLVLREYISLLMKDVEVRFRRTWALESLRTSQGV